MSYEVILTPDFKKFFKKLFKKHPSLKAELFRLIEKLERDYEAGIPLGGNLFKIRLSISSKNKGKSALTRLFDKSEFENIPKAQLIGFLKSVGLI